MNKNVADVGTIDNQERIINLFNKIYADTPKRYTVKIDKNNSSPTNRITYMHGAVGKIPAYMDYTNGVFKYGDWGDVWFIKDNYPVMLKSDGTVDYKLDPNDYTKKEDGTASDIANTSYNGNAMSRFPKVYLSFSEDAGYEYISVSNVKYDENYEPIGFINDNGEEVDEVFLSIYRGYLYDNKLRSISGYKPSGYIGAIREINYAKANGTGWDVRSWAQRQMVNALLTIISKSDNSQVAFGNGNYDSGDSADYLSTSGGLNNKGQFYGYNDATHQVKVFHIEDWWGSQRERIVGLVNSNGTIKVAMHGPYNVYGSGSNYKTIITIPNQIFYSYGANCKCDNSCGRLPISDKSVGGNYTGSSSTFLCDGLDISVNIEYCLLVGSYCHSTLRAGASSFEASWTISNADWGFGACLSYTSPVGTTNNTSNSGGGGYVASGS